MDTYNINMTHEKEKIKEKLNSIYNKVMDREKIKAWGSTEDTEIDKVYMKYIEKSVEFLDTLNEKQSSAYKKINMLSVKHLELEKQNAFELGFYEGIKYYKQKLLRQEQNKNNNSNGL